LLRRSAEPQPPRRRFVLSLSFHHITLLLDCQFRVARCLLVGCPKWISPRGEARPPLTALIHGRSGGELQRWVTTAVLHTALCSTAAWAPAQQRSRGPTPLKGNPGLAPRCAGAVLRSLLRAGQAEHGNRPTGRVDCRLCLNLPAGLGTGHSGQLHRAV